MPNLTRFSGVAIIVTISIKIPSPKIIIPLLSFLVPRGSQKPEIKINVQHINCCHMYEISDSNQGISNLNI